MGVDVGVIVEGPHRVWTEPGIVRGTRARLAGKGLGPEAEGGMKLRDLLELLRALPAEAEVDLEIIGDSDEGGVYVGECRSVRVDGSDGTIVLSQEMPR